MMSTKSGRSDCRVRYCCGARSRFLDKILTEESRTFFLHFNDKLRWIHDFLRFVVLVRDGDFAVDRFREAESVFHLGLKCFKGDLIWHYESD